MCAIMRGPAKLAAGVARQLGTLGRHRCLDLVVVLN